MRDEEIRDLFRGFGHEPLFVAGDDPKLMHQTMADALDVALASIRSIQQHARDGRESVQRPRWPMIVLRSPKGWTGPKEVDGKKVEGFWRAHQVPVIGCRENPAHLKVLEDWMRSYEPEKLFDANGALFPELQALAPEGVRRMGANPHANGGLLKRELKLPDFRSFAIEVPQPGGAMGEATRELGKFLRDVIRLNAQERNFRIMGPDETASNRLDAVFEATERVWMEPIESYDVHLAQDGRVMEVLSEHLCQGWLEGYLLTGRHGFFS